MYTFYYVIISGERNGPYTLGELLFLGIDTETLLWNGQMKDWTKAKDIPEVAEQLAGSPPPIPVEVVKSEKPIRVEIHKPKKPKSLHMKRANKFADASFGSLVKFTIIIVASAFVIAFLVKLVSYSVEKRKLKQNYELSVQANLEYHNKVKKEQAEYDDFYNKNIRPFPALARQANSLSDQLERSRYNPDYKKPSQSDKLGYLRELRSAWFRSANSIAGMQNSVGSDANVKHTKSILEDFSFSKHLKHKFLEGEFIITLLVLIGASVFYFSMRLIYLNNK